MFRQNHRHFSMEMLLLCPLFPSVSKSITCRQLACEVLFDFFTLNVPIQEPDKKCCFRGEDFVNLKFYCVIPGLFWRIHMMELIPSLIFFVLISGLSTYFMAMAYRNTKFALKHKVAVKREDGVTREMHKILAEDKKMSRKEKDERTLWKKNEVADYEATTFAIFYNNALFLAIIIFTSFYLLRTISPSLNYILSVSGASGLLCLLSTSKPT